VASWRSSTTTDGDTYRAVYTVRYQDVVYVLHCFQKN
jgi:phage-related protein